MAADQTVEPVAISAMAAESACLNRHRHGLSPPAKLIQIHSFGRLGFW